MIDLLHHINQKDDIIRYVSYLRNFPYGIGLSDYVDKSPGLLAEKQILDDIVVYYRKPLTIGGDFLSIDAIGKVNGRFIPIAITGTLERTKRQCIASTNGLFLKDTTYSVLYDAWHKFNLVSILYYYFKDGEIIKFDIFGENLNGMIIRRATYLPGISPRVVISNRYATQVGKLDFSGCLANI